jgi:hypothetical protein
MNHEGRLAELHLSCEPQSANKEKPDLAALLSGQASWFLIWSARGAIFVTE